jgi:acetylornithine deacetylase
MLGATRIRITHAYTRSHEIAPTVTDVLDLHRRLVAIPSLSQEEGPAADFVTEIVRAAGLPVERLDDNVYFQLGDGEDRLLLNSHLDVVPPSAEHPFPPFAPTVRDGKVYGRGAVDAKASVAAMLAAVLDLAREGFDPRGGAVWVAFTACEEIGGGYNGLEALRPHLPPLSAGLVGEPTDLLPCTAQKGLLILHVEAHGKTAHAARAHLGDNAIVHAARDVLRLAKHTFERHDSLLGSPTVSVTVIEGGTARNVVPDRCRLTLDVRSVPAYTHEELAAEIASVVEGEVCVFSDRIVPTSTPADARIVRACREALPAAEPFGSPTTSDWIFLRDVPVVKIGPGSSLLSHTAEEHVVEAEVLRAVGVYRDIIRAYFALV